MDTRETIVECTHCGVKLTNMKFYTGLSIVSFVMKESGAWEEMPNLNVTTNEVVCQDCFLAFSAIVGERMNSGEEKTGEEKTIE